jgi:hypothetical protein
MDTDTERHDHQSDLTTGTTRRRLLGAATGGFALATSGLFLPEGLEATQAREGALSGAKGGRHGKNHKRRHRHRSQGDHKKDKDHRLSGSPIRYAAIRAATVIHTNVVFYYRTLDGWGRFSSLKFGKFEEIPDSGSDSHVDYAPKMYSIAAYYDSDALPVRVLVEVCHPPISLFPWAKVTWGCTIDGQGNVVGGTTYTNDGFSEIWMAEDALLSFDTTANDAGGKSVVRVQRLRDSDSHKWFTASVHSKY